MSFKRVAETNMTRRLFCKLLALCGIFGVLTVKTDLAKAAPQQKRPFGYVDPYFSDFYLSEDLHATDEYAECVPPSCFVTYIRNSQHWNGKRGHKGVFFWSKETNFVLVHLEC